MKKSIFFIQDFNHLIRLTYSLADELAALHVFKMIYYQKNDMNFEEWRTIIHQTFAAIDHIIVDRCEIPVFYLGLHDCLKVEHDQQFEITLTAPLKEAVDQFAQEFCAAISIIHQYFEENRKLNSKKSISKQKYLNEISIFCKQLIELILSEVGLKCSDLSEIY